MSFEKVGDVGAECDWESGDDDRDVESIFGDMCERVGCLVG